MSDWRTWLTGPNPTWLQRLARIVLRAGCIPYGIAVTARNLLFDWGLKRSQTCGVPVVSIGNLSVGGTGKSPMVAWIATWFRDRGRKVAILSRGYGQLGDGRNDEALELEAKLPDVLHLQNRDRVGSARCAVEEYESQVLVLDDGFQHRRLARDLDIVLIDATDPPPARLLMPAGLRREPIWCLRRAQAVVFTRADQVDRQGLDQMIAQTRDRFPHLVCATAVHRATTLVEYPDRRLALNHLVGTRVLAFCGIGNPEAFFSTLGRLGAELVDRRAWPDHHAYSSEDFEWLANWSNGHGDTKLVCTMKDWVKIRRAKIGAFPLWALAIELEFIDGLADIEALLIRIDGESCTDHGHVDGE